MKNVSNQLKHYLVVLGISALFLIACSNNQIEEQVAQSAPLEEQAIQSAPFTSVSVLEFGPDNVLFVGDSTEAKIVAIELGEATPNSGSQAYKVLDLEDKIAEYLNTKRTDIRVMDMKVHPQTKDAYLAVHRGFSQERTSHILIVDLNGNIDELDYAEYESTSIDIQNAPAGTRSRFLAITDIDYHTGNIHVAGMSNEEFSFALRKIPYRLMEP